MRPYYIDSGKSYAKVVRGHRFTLKVLWQLLLPQLLTFLEGAELKYLLDIAQGMLQKTLITWLLHYP